HRLEAVDDAAAEHRDRRAPSLLVQPGELAEVVAARLLVRDAAAQAEAERRGHERGPDPVGGSGVAVENGAVRENAHDLRDVLAPGRDYLRVPAGVQREPVVGQPLLGQSLSRRIRPGRLLGDVEVPGLVVIAAPMPYDGAPRLLLTRDRQVLLAALAAEGQREKQLVRLTRDP